MTHLFENDTMLTVGSNRTIHCFPINSKIIMNAPPYPIHINMKDLKKAFLI
jgi:hypothetical protein